jgi:hypothetical protein
MPDGSVKQVRVRAHATRDDLGNLEYVGAAAGIPMLVEYLTERYAGKIGKKIKNIDKGTLKVFQAYIGPVTQQEHAAKPFEAVYARHPNHPGALHYLIHACDDPEHAQQGLNAARAYAQAAAAVPHALHMPSHIFTRLGYWDESAATNLKGWEVSEADVKRAGQSGAYRDFHNLNYLE